MLETMHPGVDQEAADRKLAKHEADERLAQAEIEKLTNGELTRRLESFREAGVMLRRGIYDMVRQAREREEMQRRLEDAVGRGGVLDWEADMPHPDSPEARGWQPPLIDAQEVLKRRISMESDFLSRTGRDEMYLTSWLQGLNELAQAYSLNFRLDKESLIQTQLQHRGGLARWNKLGERESIAPDQYVLARFSDAIKARLWELTTPES